jgi:superfamily II DNA/RNA helicase
LVLVPNRELAIQVCEEGFKPFHYEVPLKFASIYAGQSHKIETQKLEQGVDGLVATLERLRYRRDGQKLFLSNLSSLVIDELDTFLDAGNEQALCKIIEQHLTDGARKNIQKQLIMCSATVNKQMEAMARRFFDPLDPDFKIIVEKSTHMNLSNLKHEFIQLADYDKVQPLHLICKEYRKYARKHDTSCIVFCNSVASARAIEHALAGAGMKSASLHGDIPPKKRLENYLRFKKREADVLVATDLASRGLDMPFVSHVINFDFPRTTSDYLHRAGRAGRAGREGFVLSLCRERDAPILEEMKLSHDNQEPLKIRGSAYSLQNKELMPKVPASTPRIGTQPRELIAQEQRYRPKKAAKPALVKHSPPGMRAAGEGKKLAKEDERILRMKNKPTRRHLTDQDLPKFKGGRKWRTWNSSSRAKEAI